VNKKELHNLTRNRIKTVFKAKQRDTLVFSSVRLSLQLTFVVVVLTLVAVFTTNSVQSNRAQDVLFGVEQTTNIFPTKVTSTGWTDTEGVFTQDLPDYALYQEFSGNNSAQLPTGYIDDDVEEVQIDAVPESANQSSTDSGSGEDTQSEEPSGEITAPEEPVVPEPEPEPEPTPEPEPPSEPVTFNYLEKLLTGVKNQASGLYPLAQLSITSSTEPTVGVDESVVEETVVDEGVVEEVEETTETPVEEIVPDVPGAYDITLSGFDIADFDDGQFVDGMQLRISFGARTKDENPSVVPYVDVLFGDDESLQSVGSILIDEEASNAINGGYYLFTLPSFIPVEELADSKVVLRYKGSNEELEGMYLDAAWLEMNTRVLSQEDLEERGVAEQLTHLEAPKLSVLLSDQLNFDRTETPIFNLRYEPQQNVILRGLRKLFGQSSFEVDSISVNHKAIGHIDIEPEVTIASDGLVTIELPTNQTKDLPPGTYEINILFNENGTEYTDTFNFQWGILTINPNKTEYEVGEVATLSIGALSPNGNTLCEAELALYVTNPEGFIAKVPVTPSGECNGNNIINVPDYRAQIPVDLAGDYQLYLERVDETGALIGFTTDSFKSVATQTFSIERNGPTRIYPKAAYPMELTVATDESFDGVLKERVPASFVIGSTTADITQDGEWQVLTWDIDISGAGSQTVSYGFDAPDISPYLYNLGVASLEGEVSRTKEVIKEIQTETGSSTDGTITFATSTVTQEETSSSNETVFEEHRQWQIASDAVGSMIIMWDGPTIPTGWTCVSCTGGDVFFQRFIVGSSTAGLNGGVATHTHTASAAVAATGGTVAIGNGGANNYSSAAHTHTFAPTIATANNLPSYRNLVILQHNSAGEPTSIPAGTITLFDTTVPTGWTQYSAQNGFYVRGESVANRTLTGGSNTHTHGITGNLSAPGGTANGTAGAVNIANNTHIHSVSGSTAAENSQPPYIEMIIGKLNATSTMPNGAITMWSEDAPTDWNSVSGTGGILENRFFKPSATYGTTGGANTHTPANVNGIISGASTANNTRGGAGSTRATAAHTHSVNVTGFSSASILPPFRSAVFAKRAGGQPPAAPVIHELFDQEKTGTSTPEFEFTANDSVGTDTLVYQFQWDTDSDLDTARIGDRASDNETGCSPNCFENTVSGGDTNPFNENERIRFTIQDPLTDGTTYYYRMRAKKTTGTTWGTWSNVNTFTYVADTDPSQWLQTVDAQFSTGVFSGTEVFGSDSVRIASAALDEVMVAYGEGVVTTPRYRIWDGTAWSAEASAQSVGGTVQWVKTAAATTRDEYVLGVQDAVNDVNVQIFNGTTDTWGNLVEVITTIPDNTRRGFDVAYETTSSDALIVYCNGTDAAYRVWNGTSWSAQTTITTASANNCNYISLASDPVSDEIIMVTRDTSAGATDYEALVWSGSAWGNSITGGSIVDTNNEGMAVEYEESGGQAIVVVANGAGNSFVWTTWNGTEWSTAATQAVGNDFQWATLKADQGSDSMALCYMDTDADVGVVRWNGESWAANQEIETTSNADTGRAISCEFETTAGRDGYIMMPYSDTTNARYRFWNGTTLSTEASVSTILDSWEVGSVRAADGKILTTWHDDDTNTQYDFSYWDGTAWSSIQTLEGSPSVTADPRRQPIDMSARIYQFVQGSFTTDPVSFGLVPGRPTWGEASWTATEGAGTSVEIQVLYATTSACNVLVPDGALPGNSAGFTAADAPINLSSLSTTTYSSLCLRATLTSQSQNIPTLDDWTISWERQPFLVQSQYRWYANRNLETPNDIWPVGGVDLLQNEAIAQAYSPGSGDVLRLRMALRADNAPLAASSDAFTLQYSQSSGLCASSTTWYDVGEVGSTTTPWRGYNNLLAFDGSTLGTLLLGSDVAGTYEEENDSDINPNTVALGNEVEYDWVLEHNGALDGVQYCFRMINDSGAELSGYEQIPSLITNASPVPPTLEKVFDNEQVASTSPWFEFSTTDPEGEDITYQIQVDDSYDFSSTVLDRNSTTNLSEFENIVTPADKDAFTMGQTIRFKPSSALSNNTTYYWRVRGKDGTGSNDWGEWSTVQSLTVNTGTAVTTWYQTQTDQFNTNQNADTETTGSNDVILTPTFSVGTTTSTAIDFDGKTTGNAWGSLSWNNNLAAGSIRYAVEYLDNGEWVLIPNAFLPGNSTGFTSSPVSLLSLDPQIHNEIRVRAVLSDVGGTPRLLDWKIEWGFAVEQPTQISLFDNEKTGTTTPTFTFTTTDPDNDDIQYELSWSTDSTFTTGVNVATSGVSAGFANVTTGADTSPFFSGDTIRYKVQSALTNGTTYWWRVRGRDPADGNAWSVWSPERSFTVDTSVSVSTWFQTTDAQFETDALNDTETTGSGGAEVASIIREAMFAYAEGTIQTPRYRLWNGSTWSLESSGVSVGGSIRFVEVAATQARNEYVIATQENGGRVRAQVYDGTTDVFDDLQTIVAAVPGVTSRGFDVAYESTSGDALVVACNGTEATYSVWNGSSWSGATAITLAVTANCNWIELASDPTSDEIILVVRDAITGATDYEALVWNGSTWGNSMTMGSAAEANDAGLVVEYEESGTQAVVVVSNGGAASFVWNSWNGSAWSGIGTQGLQDDFENGRFSRDVGSDNMALCSIDNDGQMALVRWTGSSNTWNAFQTIELTGNSKTGHPSDCVFETTSGRDGFIMMPYSDLTNARYQFWNGTILSGEASISTIQDSQEVRAIRTGDGNILSFFYDDVNTQYDFSYWNGVTWSTIQTLEATAITTAAPATIPFGVAARRYPTFTEGSVVSSAIDFDEGSGLKWQSVSFNNTTPGSSDILYQIEYLNGDTWELIPNGALAGNSTGFTNSPIDISNVSRITYNTIRLKANLACVSGNCPTLNDWTVTWSSGINVAGTIKQYNQTASTTSGTIAVAVNGVVQGGKTATVVNGAWSIANVTAFPGDTVTTFVTGAADTAEAVGVTTYDGDGDITGMPLFERHLSLGSNDATTTPITNADIGSYDFTNSEDLFFNVNGSTLSMCADTGCFDAELYVKVGMYYTPGGRILTHDFENNGIFTAGSFTHEINGSWDNNATTTMTGSTVVFAATSTSESIDNTGAASIGFNNVTVGTTTGSGTWNLSSTFDINGNLTVSRGTLARGTTQIFVVGNLLNETNGVWTGVGTTTFDGNTAATWRNQNPTPQNTGNTVIDGTSKIVTLASNVAAQSISIGANDTLDASTSNYDITVYGRWNNQNNFLARSGEVIFAAGTAGQTITTTGDAFYDLTFNGGGGGWAFTENAVQVGNDLRVAQGTVTLPSATTTIAGSFNATGGTFQNNNGTMLFTSGSAETLTFAGGTFTNVAYNLQFTGAGSWTVADTNATSTNNVRVTQGTLNFPSGVFAIGGLLADTGGVYTGGTGTVRFYSATAKILTAGGSSFNNVTFDGTGSWSFTDTNVSVNRNLTVTQGTLTLPSIAILIAGSYDNNATVVPGTGTVQFNSNDAGETIDFGASPLYNVVFNNATGGWTIVSNGTTTNALTLTAATNLTVNSGVTLSVGTTFTNSVGGAATTWTGSTLALRAGNYSLNTKTTGGDAYGTLAVAANTDIKMWNSVATAYAVNGTGSLYSQDHNALDGDLYIFGGYERTSGTEYWSYATDFDGTALGGTPRQVDVRIASGASASFIGSTVQILGISTASTTVANQGSGTYTVNVTGGSATAQYYQFTDLGGSGLSLLGGVSVGTFGNGSFTVGAAAGSAITLSSTTINANPSKQISNVRFATTTAIAATNVTQTDGVPSSFWWFKDGTGNLYGENYDNDTGNPGSVRFNDSSLVFTISGTVYSDAGATPLTGGTCDGTTPVVRIVVNGGTSYTGSCSNVNGSYSIPGVTVSGDPTITIYLDNASGGQRGSVITRTPTANITNADIYVNRVIVRHEDVDPVTIANLAVYDSTDDLDLRFTATSNLSVHAGNELYIWNSKTFTPGGTVSLLANAGANSYDGTVYIDDNAVFNAYASTTLTVGGRFVLDTAAAFNAASSTVLMNATTSGKSITAPGTITFNNLTFNGSGGTWNIGANITANGNIAVTTGTVTGTGNISLLNGSLSGNGTLSLGAGTTTIARTNTLGGTSAWTFYNLQLGNGSVVGTTTPSFTATTTIAGRLTIAAAHFLDANATNWDLSGTGTVFVENGTFLEDTSTVRYSGTAANVRSTGYYNLDINAGAGSQTYTATGLGISVLNKLTVGGTGNATFNLTASDPLLDVNGSVLIRSNGTLSASDTNTFTIAGNYTNNGTFTSNGGTVTFDGAATTAIAAGNSSFANVRVAAAGSVSVTQHATATTLFRLQSASGFTVASGQSLAVGGTFFNAVGGAATTWTGSTLRLYGNGNYSINAATTTDTYATLSVDGTTQIRVWNSDAGTYDIDGTASLYSQDHANNAGDLYIWGSYRKTSGSDHWSYATDFDGTALGGGARKVDVFMAAGSSVSVTGGSLGVYGTASASTTLQNQGSGSYGILIGGTASSSFQYYEMTDANSSGLVLTGTPTINSLSFSDFLVSQNGGTAITVGGTVITQNPAKNFTRNRFVLDGVAGGFNVTATGTSISAWRFANHTGDIDGEAFDVDPNGDPGYVAWDDSAALITVSGNVYSDEGTTTSGVCDGVTNNVTVRVAGITSYSTTCNATTGAYSISGVSYGSADSIVVYIDGETEKGASVTQDPITNITNFNIYENRVIVRHESTGALTIDDMSVWDSSDDADIPFAAVSGSPDTLTLPANRKLIIASGKTFTPGGTVTISGGGAGAAYDGTLELFSNAVWNGAGTEAISVGGSMILNSGADFNTSNGTTTFTTTGSARTIDLNQNPVHNVAFTGSGSWNITDSTFTVNGNARITAGTVDLPTGTSTFNGSFTNTGGAFDANNGSAYFNGGATHTVRMGGSNFATTTFSGGTYTITDTSATSTGTVRIESGTLRLPSTRLTVGGNFVNSGGAILHNNSELVMLHPSAATLRASSSDLYGVTFAGGGSYTMLDTNITLLDSLLITNGAVQFASGTVAIGGSFEATGGTFAAATTTLLFNSSDTGEIINPGVSEFYAVQIAAPTGGYSLTGSATTTHNFSLLTAASFTAQSGTTLRVEGVFTNTVGGSATNWNGSTLVLAGANQYSLNQEATGSDRYNTLIIGANTDVRMWKSSATTTSVAASGSLYSQDHATVNGFLYIYGDFHISAQTEYWSYATDFNGTALGGSPRAVTVHHAANASTTVDGGTLNIVGVSGNETLITNQGSGTYGLNVSAGTFNASYYEFRNLGLNGLTFTGTPAINSLSYGDFELAVNGGSLITVASSTLNANASLVFTGNRFATTTAITGTNVTLNGATSNAWTFSAHTGNLDGEVYDDDGIDECGSIRWTDSECLITQQVHYRWRNDDGGVGVPNSEWYNASWDARKAVRVENLDAAVYSNAVVQLFVDFDADMQADFEDLRFTSDNGTTIIPHWIGSSTDSSRAEVWVKVPTLPSEDTATVFMYYNNPTATSTSNMENTFVAADDFEDNDISEYSGQTTLFDVDATFVYDGAYGLNNGIDDEGRANLGGIYRLDQTVSQGETFRFLQYIDTATGTGDETCVKFGVQSPGSANDNYGVCLEQYGTQRISLVKDVVDNDASGTILASSTLTYVTGWYEVEVEWVTGGNFLVSLYNEAGTLVTSFTDSDNSYSSGGIGITYWFHHGGWDSIGSRPTLANEPTIRFGAEQGDGGASWKASLDTAASYDVADIARLRIAIKNSGLAITNQQLLLEYAAMGAAPSCEAVNPANFDPVPVQASCGTSPVCMQSSILVTNAATIGDLLFGPNGTFTAGQLREDPSNISSNLNIGQDQYTEMEYVITPTANTVDENLCFRVTNNGTPFDTYLSVAHMTFRFDPTLSNVVLNGGNDISLLPGTTTRVYATTTVTDLNGPGDLAYATTTFYRSMVSGGPICTPNNNDCYVSSGSQCSFSGCIGNTCELACYADIFFHADATDVDAQYEGEEWIAVTEVEDFDNGYDFETSIGQVMNTLRAIDVNNAISYGSLAASSNTGSYNASTTVENLGNVEINLEVEGTDMTDGVGAEIPADRQKFATSTFSYGGCTTCLQLSSTTPVALDVDLSKPTTNTPPVEDAIYWGVEVPLGINAAPHQGINVFTPRSVN
jgi:Domain of unknown function (DUF2341)